MSRARKATPLERLMAAMDRCAIARGEAQYTSGYRSASGVEVQDRMWARQQAQWKVVDDAEAKFRRLAQRLLREARDAP